jgi:transposase
MLLLLEAFNQYRLHTSIHSAIPIPLLSKSETARRFGVHRATVKRYCKRLDERGILEPRKVPGKKPKLDEKARKLLLEGPQERPWATHSQRAEFLFAVLGRRVSEATVCRAVGSLHRSRKKDPEGQQNETSNTTLLTSRHQEGMGPSMAVEGATTTRVFEAYVERLLVPALRPGQVVVMDNLGAHRPKRVRELIEARGCELIYLPPLLPRPQPHRGSPQRRSSTSSGRSASAPRRP